MISSSGMIFRRVENCQQGATDARLDRTVLKISSTRRNGFVPRLFCPYTMEDTVADIREHMKIIGKDGAPVGTVDRVEGTRIKLTKSDSPAGHEDHHHYIDTQLVGAVEGDIVKLS